MPKASIVDGKQDELLTRSHGTRRLKTWGYQQLCGSDFGLLSWYVDPISANTVPMAPVTGCQCLLKHYPYTFTAAHSNEASSNFHLKTSSLSTSGSTKKQASKHLPMYKGAPGQLKGRLGVERHSSYTPSRLWAAWYSTRLPVKGTPKGVIFSYLCFSTPSRQMSAPDRDSIAPQHKDRTPQRWNVFA